MAKTLALTVLDANGKRLDTVFMSKLKPSETVKDLCERAKRGLVSHDGYSNDTRVILKKGQRVTYKLHVVQANYGSGWEDVTYEETLKEGKAMLKDYRQNDFAASSHRLTSRREYL